MLRPREALKDFRTVAKKAPHDRDARLKLAECEKVVRQIEFSKAIEVGDPPSALEGLDLDAMAVDDSYDGVRLEDSGGSMTPEFIDDMISRFKAGKRIHRKYVFRIILAVKEIVAKEPTMVEVDVEAGKKLTVCGDTHGEKDIKIISCSYMLISYYKNKDHYFWGVFFCLVSSNVTTDRKAFFVNIG